MKTKRTKEDLTNGRNFQQENIPFYNLLILIGQRWTSATLKDKTGIPPPKATLLQSSFASFNTQICYSTRAWEKHIGKSTDQFWGVQEGNPKQKEEKARPLITNILEHVTWWNIFTNYKHGIIYEARVSSSHGIRWNAKGTNLIGFLEPFQ